MIAQYYTLLALVEEWKPRLVSRIVGDVYSQTKDQFSLALASPDDTITLQVGIGGALRFMFVANGYNRAKRNVKTIFYHMMDKVVTDIRVADRDRMIFVDFSDGFCLQIVLFGSQANVFHVNAKGVIIEAFRDHKKFAGTIAPKPRPAVEINSFDAFLERLPRKSTVLKDVTRVFPFLDRVLIQEVLFRADVDGNTPDGEVSESQYQRIYDEAVLVEKALEKSITSPEPVLYWNTEAPVRFSLIPMQHLEQEGGELRAESFETVGGAVSIFAKKGLSARQYQDTSGALLSALKTSAKRLRSSVSNMETELLQPSRADKYERFGHLLMAMQSDVKRGQKEVELPDFYDENRPVLIKLDEAKSAVENAERYYGKARNTRQSREHAERRFEGVERRLAENERFLAEVEALKTAKEVMAYRKEHGQALAEFIKGDAAGESAKSPFRVFTLPEGYEVWVGRNSKQNDLLTFKHTRKFDLWMHARGLPGSHTVLRLKDKSRRPAPYIIEIAAGIAAWFSEARSTGLAPVQFTEKKFVRKAKGGVPGKVIVDREEVVIVPPALPK